jgi:uncharacterized BrkB/YihY/UPF0761 family membrane protein
MKNEDGTIYGDHRLSSRVSRDLFLESDDQVMHLKYKDFLIFAIVFVLLVTLVSGSFGALALLLLTQTSQPGPKDIAVPVLLFLIPLLAIAFLIGLFMIGKWMGRTDEARMNELLYRLFADVAVRPR